MPNDTAQSQPNQPQPTDTPPVFSTPTENLSQTIEARQQNLTAAPIPETQTAFPQPLTQTPTVPTDSSSSPSTNPGIIQSDPFPGISTPAPVPEPPPQLNPASTTPPSMAVPPVITPPAPQKSKAKIVGALLALAILLIGIPAGVFLINKNSLEVREKAAVACDNGDTWCDNGTQYRCENERPVSTGTCTTCGDNECSQDGSCHPFEEYQTDQGCPAGQARRVRRDAHPDGVCRYTETQPCQASSGSSTIPSDSSTSSSSNSGSSSSSSGFAGCGAPCGGEENRECADPLICLGEDRAREVGAPKDTCWEACRIEGSACGGDFCGCCNGLTCTGGYCRQPASSGSSTTLTAQCRDIKAYDTSWNQLSAAKLTQIKVGDTLRFAVSGTASSGTISKARFRINGSPANWAETTDKRGDEYYYVHTILPGITNLRIEAQLFHDSAGWF